MKKYFTVFIITFFLFSFSSAHAQWSGGILVNVREEYPKWGLGFLISRNLALQFPTVGFKIRLEADLFKEEVGGIDLSEKSFFVSLAGTFFLRPIEPYISLAPGYAFISAGDEDSNAFIIEGAAGVQLGISDPVYPFLEIKGRQYLVNTGEQRFDIVGSAGVRFEF